MHYNDAIMFRFIIKQPFQIAADIFVFAKIKFLVDICNHKLLLDITKEISYFQEY